MFKRSVLSAAALAAVALPVWAAPELESVAVPAEIRCNTQAGGVVITAVHADKIVFRITGALLAAVPVDQAALDALPRNTELDIKVLDNPRKVADLKAKVLTFLGAVNVAANRQAIDIHQVTYAMVCPLKPFVPPGE